jgi:hypothetical protein
MYNIAQFSENEIIERLKSKNNKNFLNEFLIYCDPIIYEVIAEYEKMHGIKFEGENKHDIYRESVEKLKNVFTKRTHKINIKKSLNNYIKAVIRNVIRDQGRSVLSGEKYRFESLTPIEDELEDHKIPPPGTLEYYGDDGSGRKIEYYKKIPVDTLEGIERSLKYVEIIYKTKEVLKSIPYYKILKILGSAWVDLSKLINKEIRDINEKHSRYSQLLLKKIEKYLNRRGLPDIVTLAEELKNEDLPEEIFHDLGDLLKKLKNFNIIYEKEMDLLSIDEQIELENLARYRICWDSILDIKKLFQEKEKNYFKNFNIDENLIYILPVHRKDLSRWSVGQNAYIMDELSRFRIRPLRLMFEVWKRDQGLKKGKYINRSLVLRTFKELNKKYKNTNLGFLFKDINEKDFEDAKSAIKFFENLRKSAYKKPSVSKKFYQDLVKSIYKVSFVDKIEANDFNALEKRSKLTARIRFDKKTKKMRIQWIRPKTT